jgi:hypothetical protein
LAIGVPCDINLITSNQIGLLLTTTPGLQAFPLLITTRFFFGVCWALGSTPYSFQPYLYVQAGLHRRTSKHHFFNCYSTGFTSLIPSDFSKHLQWMNSDHIDRDLPVRLH